MSQETVPVRNTQKPNYRLFFVSPTEPQPGPWIYCGETELEGFPYPRFLPLRRAVIAYEIPKGWGIREDVFINRKGLVNYLMHRNTDPNPWIATEEYLTRKS